MAQTSSQSSPQPANRTVIADLLMIDGAFYVVRGDRGEIRIEVTPETQLSEVFAFGDRIKAILLPNDEAIAITRALPGESIGTQSGDSSSTPSTPSSTSKPASSQPPSKVAGSSGSPKVAPAIRTIIANILMVDGNFYIIRSDYGEIQIEVTPQTQLSESFKFGDRIKARVTPEDRALSIVRATPDEPTGIRVEEDPILSTPTGPSAGSSELKSPLSQQDQSDTTSEVSSKIRTVVVEVLMIDGDLFIARGDRGEIRIEVTPETVMNESFKFGDKIKARLLPNNTALSIERAEPDQSLGTLTP